MYAVEVRMKVRVPICTVQAKYKECKRKAKCQRAQDKIRCSVTCAVFPAEVLNNFTRGTFRIKIDVIIRSGRWKRTGEKDTGREKDSEEESHAKRRTPRDSRPIIDINVPFNLLKWSSLFLH